MGKLSVATFVENIAKCLLLSALKLQHFNQDPNFTTHDGLQVLLTLFYKMHYVWLISQNVISYLSRIWFCWVVV